MANSRFTTQHLVTLVGGGPVAEAQIRAALGYAPILLAVDRGADRAEAFGARPRAVFGDLDSISSAQAWRDKGVPVHHIPEQDSVDFEKGLSQIDAPGVLGVGFLGGRVDHELAALNMLARHHKRAVVLLGERDCICLAPPEIRLDVPAGTRVSLFPLEPVAGWSSEGLEWPLAGLTLSPTGQVGTSNRALGRVRITKGAGACVLILPVRCLAEMLAGLGLVGGARAMP